MGRLTLKDLFHPRGRINRVDFLVGGMLLAIFGVCLGFAIGTIMGMINALPAPVVALIQIVLTAPLAYGQFCLGAKRLHDLNLPAVLALFSFVELIFTVYVAFTPPALLPAALGQNITTIDNSLMGIVVVFSLLLLFIPGTNGENRYGRRTVADARPQAHNLEG